MIPLGGLSTGMAVRLVESTREKQGDLIERNALNARQIEAFKERIADIDSPAALIEDTEVYTFVMRAFDLEDQIFGKAMIRKVLESDIDDRGALVNRLTDPRFREMHKAFEFAPGGGPSFKVIGAAWQEKMIDRFVERQLINTAGEDSRGAGLALEFKSRAPEINTWFDVLKNRDVAEVMRTALGIPKEMATLDIDRQAEHFAKKFDIEKLKDPKEVEKLVSKFSAIHDALNGGPAMAMNPTVQLMQSAVGGGGGFAAITIDIDAVQRLGSVSRYR